MAVMTKTEARVAGIVLKLMMTNPEKEFSTNDLLVAVYKQGVIDGGKKNGL